MGQLRASSSSLLALSLLGCEPGKSSTSPVSACEAGDNDCTPIEQVHSLSSESSISVESAYATAAALSGFGPDASDPVYLGDGTYGLLLLPYHNGGGTFDGDGIVLLDGGNVSVTASSLSGTAATLSISTTVKDTTKETLVLDSSSRFSSSAGNLLYDHDGSAGTAAVTIGTISCAETPSGSDYLYTCQVGFSYASLVVADVELLIEAFAYTYSGSFTTTGNRTVTATFDEDGAGSSPAVTSSFTLRATADPYVFPADISLAFTEGDSATAIDSLLTVHDTASAAAISSATIEITSGAGTGDALSISTGSLPSGVSYSSGSSTSTKIVLNKSSAMSGTTTAFRDALRLVKFNNTSEAPTAGTRQITVSLTDNSSSNVTTSLYAVTVTGVDDAPTDIALSATSVSESATAGTVIATVSVTDVDSSAFTYTVKESGVTSTRFGITSGQLVVLSGASLNYESATSHSITIEVSDGSATYSEAFTITVTNTNDEDPVFTSSSTGSIAEGLTSTILTVTTTDADAGDTATYSLVGGADQSFFSINSSSGALKFGSARDYETPADSNGDNIYAVTVRATDTGSNTTDQSIQVTVTNTNDESPVFTSSSTASVPENSTTALTLVATDADAGDTITYSITGGADQSDFTINSSTGVLSFAANPDYENPADSGTNNVYNLNVRATDAASHTASQSLTITVTNTLDETPVITSTATASVAENTTTVKTITATDADSGDTLTYSIVSGLDGAKFSINSSTGALSFASAPNYESPTDSDTNNVYSVTVKVTDSAGNNATQTLAVTVTDTNDETPVITSTATASVVEGVTTVKTITATDADAGDTLTYSIVSGADSGDFSINSSTGALTFAATPDYENPADGDTNNVYSVTVRVTDGNSHTASQTLTVTVTNTNDEDPVFTSTATASVVENTTSVKTVTATDADPSDTVTFSIVSGLDGAKFNITSGGVLTFASAPDYETPTDSDTNNSYSVKVRATDSASNTTDQTLTVTVTNVNDESPVFTSTATASVNEGSTTVKTVTATDADPSDTVTYSVVSGLDGAKFSINSSTGALRFVTAPDYETPTDSDTNNIYSVKVRATDSASNTTDQTLTVTVVDLNDESPVFTSSTSPSVNEDTTAVVTVTATDADAGDTITYSITGGADSSKFSINSSTGALSFASAPDYENPTDSGTNNTYVVTVRAADTGGHTTSQTITATVVDANDAPDIQSPSVALTLTSITEDQTTNAGNTILDILLSPASISTLSGLVKDDDGDTIGVALTAASAGSYGTWEYSTDCTTFSTMPTLSTSSALLLATDDCVRYKPDGTNGESTNPTLTLLFWDGSTGGAAGTQVSTTTSGAATSAFSASSLTASVTVSSVEDVPTASFYARTTSGTTITTASVGDTVVLDATASADPDNDDIICGWNWDVVSGVAPSLSPSAANNAPCRRTDSGVTSSNPVECYTPQYTVAGTTTWELEVWTVSSATSSNCTATNTTLQISTATTLTVTATNTPPTAEAGSTTSFPIDYSYTLDSGASASDVEDSTSSLSLAWTVDSIDSAYRSYFTLGNTTAIKPTIYFNSDAFEAATGATFTSANTVAVRLKLTVTDTGGKSSSDTVDLYLCLSSFADLDGDRYGNPSSYYASCSGYTSSATGSSSLATSGITQASMLGFDCLDSGSVTDGKDTFTAASVGTRIYWYADSDGDTYGQQFYEAGSTPTYSVASYPYGDADLNRVPDTCITTRPTGYVLNDDDCNDRFSVTTSAGEVLLASAQNPTTLWYNDVDGDDYGSNSAATTSFLVPNNTADGMCVCASDCGVTKACREYFSDGTSEVCTPASSGDCDVASSVKQCGDPGSSTTSSISGSTYYPPGSYTAAGGSTLLSQWVLGDGDCDEYRDSVNEGASEICDPADIDEDCNGYSDDEEPDASGVGSIYTYYADDDGDGYGDEGDAETSCGGSSSSTPRILYRRYTIAASSTSNTYFIDTDGDCSCPVKSAANCIDDEGASCTPTGGAGGLVEVTPTTCTCTQDDCSTICQNNAQEECDPDPAGTCTRGDPVNPSWFYDFDQFDCVDSKDTVYPNADELCDGQYNDCNADSYSKTSAPADEVDYDNDGYVECGYVSGWSSSSSTPKIGTDCSPNDANVYPNATNVCDGQYNNCSSWTTEYTDTTGECFCDSSTCGSTAFCVDAYGDSCTPDSSVPSISTAYKDSTGECFCQDAAGSNLCVDIDGAQCIPSGTLTSTAYFYVDSNADCLCNASGSSCYDLNGFVCTATGTTSSLANWMDCAATGDKMSPGAPSSETDGDGDCFVDCYDTDTVSYAWVGGDALLDTNNISGTCTSILDGADCDDTDITVYPGADEVCDGQINDCDTTSLPNDETDNDGDKYVDCAYDSATWAGSGSIVGGSDCDDTYKLTYPGAKETCDGEFNNCNHPLLEDFEGATGTDCFCDKTSTGGRVCQTAAGATCTPANNKFVTTTDAPSSSYPYAEVGCYCSAQDCEIDVDEDGVTDCITPAGLACTPDDADEDGMADDCLTSPKDPSTGLALAVDLSAAGIYSASGAPFDETDNDNDKYVDCEVDKTVWLGSGLIKEGEDCDDTDRYVYPGATELCDGQYNNCNNVDFDLESAPDNESDDDGDGYVECTTWSSGIWVGDSSVIGGKECDDTDDTVYPGADEICDGQYNNCSASGYSSTGAPADEKDGDGDKYLLCTSDLELKDCDDTRGTVYPNATELCDGQFNDCNHPYKRDFIGAVYEDCFCSSTSGTSCKTAAGATCTPTYGEFVTTTAASDPAPSGFDYISVSCYCPSTACYTDKDNDGTGDCVTPAGDECNPTDIAPRNALADKCVEDALDDSTGAALSITRAALGQTYTDRGPPDEMDNDSDKYVECTYTKSLWASGSDPFVIGGDDCDDDNSSNNEAKFVYPGATEYCDGIYNDCNNTAYSGVTAPTDERDKDNDGYVECDETPGIIWKKPSTDPELYGDADSDCFCNIAACSGSSAVCVNTNGDTCTPTLTTAFPECTGGNGGFSDCDDTDKVVYPNAEELCDGQYNDCNGYDSDGDGDIDEEYDKNGSPAGEIDNDGDGFANCDGYEESDEFDCDDEDDSRYPGAEELCDGQFNDCKHFLIDDFEGATTTGCYCEGTEGDASSCAEKDSAGVVKSCSPTDLVDNSSGTGTADGITDSFVTLSAAVTLGSTDYLSAEVGCYCPTSDCTIDLDLDGLSDCFTAGGVRCEIDDYDTDNDGIADNCVDTPLNPGATDSTNILSAESPTSYAIDGTGANKAPPDEYDHDGDRRVECEYTASIWVGQTTIVGGDDCDDVNSWAKLVYPGATEFCDGVFNNCSSVVDAYDDRVPPANESDDDGDGFVECEDKGIDWRHPDTDPDRHGDEDGDCFCPGVDSSGLCNYNNASSSAASRCLDADGVTCTPSDTNGDGLRACDEGGGYEDCDDKDDTVYPGAPELCDGQYNDCDNSKYSTTGAPSSEVDNDADGYVDCDNDEGVPWAGDEEPDGYGDCDDSDDTRFPSAEEVCDGIFNDCESLLLLDFAGVTSSDCYCQDIDGEIDTTGDGISDCKTSAGATCSPSDLDRDNYADHFLVTSQNIGGIFYKSAEYAAACLCASATGKIDTDGDGDPNCVDLTGQVCTPRSSSAGSMTSYSALSPTRTINGISYATVETLPSTVEEACYCPDATCIVDLDGNSISDCYTASGAICQIADIDPTDSGIADHCVAAPTASATGPTDPATNTAVVFANPTGLTVSGAPPDEVDNDGDRYVECIYTSSIWQGSALVKGGEDCDDINDNGEARYVYPGANEYCDGVFNNCNGSSTEAYTAATPPADEVDGDGDGFVDCDPNTGITWKVDATNPNPLFNIFSTSLYDTSDPYRAYYVDEAGTCYCNKQVSEADTTCDGTCITSAGATCTPVGSCSAVGGYSDCLDTIADNGADTHADAVEICDGQYNDCRDLSWTEGTSSTWPDRDTTSGTGAYTYVPSDERDDDGDSYVECDNFSGTDWLGYGEATVVGGDDCNDKDKTVYPHAPDSCDGIFNDCDSPGLATYNSAVGTGCFCRSTDGSFGASSCVTKTGTTCSPTDLLDNATGASGSDGIIDTYVTLVDAGGIKIGTVLYYSAEVSYYCESDDCTIDENGDGYRDCANAKGERATSTLSQTTAYASCITTAIDPFTFGDRDFFANFDLNNNGVVDAPLTELDLDGDGYVDCDGSGYSGTGWSSSSVFTRPTTGWDCDSVDDTVYPAAKEVCDGQYNDCNSYSSTSAPANETDNDEDGWVECARTEAIPWKPWDDVTPEPNMWHGSLADDCWCANADECELALATGSAGDGRCIDEAGQLCAPSSCDDTSSAGALTPGFAAPKGDTLVDCDDTNPDTFPGAAPMEGDSLALSKSTVMVGIDPWACANDSDGDFYGDSGTTTGVAVGSDCNDVDEDIHPYQPETCEDSEQVDSDCNGDINSADGFSSLSDWDASTHGYMYVDEDGDKYGDPNVGRIKVCAAAAGYSTNALDCDDTDLEIYPGAPEICDQVDQDCDNQIDEPDLDPVTSGCQYLYRDQDLDGYGDNDVSACLCLYGEEQQTTNPNDSNKTYVRLSGDCYDKDRKIKPLSCNDGSDNDSDGRVDEDDPSCQAGYDEYGLAEEEVIEVVDGHDNDCDGFVPVVEVDCDDDGYMPQVPVERSGGLFGSGTSYQTYADLGLGVCGNTPGTTKDLACWGTTIEVECDAPTLSVDSNGNLQVEGSGLWMLSYTALSDDLADKFTGGYRTYPSSRTLKVGDCDDQCDSRNPGESEACDQIDNNCSDTDPGFDDDGIPDALDEEVSVPGTISIAELDLDGDSYLSCGALLSITQETQFSDFSCDSPALATEEEDCEILCSLTSPGSEESCDGFVNVCDSPGEDGDEDGTLDGDRDDFRECGAWGSVGNELDNEDVYVVVWLKDVDWAKRGSEAVELARKAAPKGPTAAHSQGTVLALGPTAAADADTADTAAEPPPPPGDTGDTGEAPDTDDTDADTDDKTSADELEDFIPLLLPRTDSSGEVIACDQTLEAQLELLLGGADSDVALGRSRLRAALESGNAKRDDREITSGILLEACQREDGFCTVVQVTLGDDVDEKTYDEFVGLHGAFEGECEDHPEQWIARAVWQHDRILEARQTVIELECLRLYGAACSELDASSSLLVDAWAAGMPSASRWLDAVDTWWRELDRFDVASAHTETYLTCWGDPRDETASISAATGGDCDDSLETGADASRDRPEGPDDLIGLFLEAPADCSTCLDGIDNNCDGNIDCADPACARCFMGQGVGCSRGDDPCGQAGCALGTRTGGGSIDRMFAAALVSFFAVLYRRRRRTAA